MARIRTNNIVAHRDRLSMVQNGYNDTVHNRGTNEIQPLLNGGQPFNKRLANRMAARFRNQRITTSGNRYTAYNDPNPGETSGNLGFSIKIAGGGGHKASTGSSGG